MSPMFRKKPVTVEARQFTEANGRDLAAWSGGMYIDIPHSQPGRPVIEIPTLEGVVTAQLGDWIIKGVAGEFYPVKNTIFLQTYEPVAEVSWL